MWCVCEILCTRCLSLVTIFGVIAAHVPQTLEVTPSLNCGKWMTGVCFGWWMGLHEAGSSIQSHWLLWIGSLAITTQAWFVSSLSFISCCNQNKLFLFFLPCHRTVRGIVWGKRTLMLYSGEIDMTASADTPLCWLDDEKCILYSVA